MNGTTRSVVEDLRTLLAEDTQPEDIGLSEVYVDGRGRGKALEKKARDKRKAASSKKKKGGGDGKKTGGGHNPFKRASTLGPADARPPVKNPRVHKKTGKWKCKCSNYKCQCIAGKRKKIVKIARDYKKTYNKSYKAWRKKQQI